MIDVTVQTKSYELSEPIFHHNKDCDVLTPDRTSTSTPSQNPSSTTTRIATEPGMSSSGNFHSSEPIFHHNKDCDPCFSTPPSETGATSEPIFHHNKDCDQ